MEISSRQRAHKRERVQPAEKNNRKSIQPLCFQVNVIKVPKDETAAQIIYGVRM